MSVVRMVAIDFSPSKSPQASDHALSSFVLIAGLVHQERMRLQVAAGSSHWFQSNII